MTTETGKLVWLHALLNSSSIYRVIMTTRIAKRIAKLTVHLSGHYNETHCWLTGLKAPAN